MADKWTEEELNELLRMISGADISSDDESLLRIVLANVMADCPKELLRIVAKMVAEWYQKRPLDGPVV